MKSPESPRKILVTDFDGTLTQVDFFQAVLERLLGDDMSIWHSYCQGKITHFEALAGYYQQIRLSEISLKSLVGELGFPPQFSLLLDQLRFAHWDLVIASAGCEWYIQQLIDAQNLKCPPTIHANKGSYSKEFGLIMQLPKDSPHYDPNIGISKTSVVKSHQGLNQCVAFAGDGPTDLAPALLVEPQLRFAKGSLARLLSEKGESFVPFDRWEEIPFHLIRYHSK